MNEKKIGINRARKLNTVKEKLNKEKEIFIKLLPANLRESFRENSFISGGAIYSTYNNQEVKDYDFFLNSQELADSIRRYFYDYLISTNGELKDKDIKIDRYRGLRLVLTDNAISIGKYQIITRWTGEPKDVVEEFDFQHNQFYLYRDEIGTLSQWDFLDDNILRFNDRRPRDIAGCIIRVNKFTERGFKIRNKEMAKMLLKLNEVGFNDREMEILNSTGEFES